MSALIHEKFAFVHVPKTGGTWAMSAMSHAGLEFELLGGTVRPHPYHDEIEAPFKFGFVRHPVAWYSSWWSFFHENDVPIPGPFERTTKELSYPDWVDYMRREKPGYMAGFYQAYVGAPGSEIDFIGHQENMADDLERALDMAGVEFDRSALREVPPANESKNKPLTTPELEAIISANEYVAIERFGYAKQRVS